MRDMRAHEHRHADDRPIPAAELPATCRCGATCTRRPSPCSSARRGRSASATPPSGPGALVVSRRSTGARRGRSRGLTEEGGANRTCGIEAEIGVRGDRDDSQRPELEVRHGSRRHDEIRGIHGARGLDQGEAGVVEGAVLSTAPCGSGELTDGCGGAASFGHNSHRRAACFMRPASTRSILAEAPEEIDAQRPTDRAAGVLGERRGAAAAASTAARWWQGTRGRRAESRRGSTAIARPAASGTPSAPIGPSMGAEGSRRHFAKEHIAEGSRRATLAARPDAAVPIA